MFNAILTCLLLPSPQYGLYMLQVATHEVMWIGQSKANTRVGTMRAPSTILRSFSLRRIQPRVAVAPLTEKTPFAQQLTAELDTLQSRTICEPNFACANGLVQLLDASITAQKIALESLVNVTYRDDLDRRALEEYLESNVEILDACNYFIEKKELIRKYVEALRVAAHLIDECVMPNAMAIKRALDQLESCHAIERECKVLGKRGLCFRRFSRQKLSHETEFSEIMCGSKAMALIVCRFLELGLSFDNLKRHLPATMKPQPMRSSWLSLLQEMAKQEEGSEKLHKRRSGSSSMMSELEQTVSAARDLKQQITGNKEKEMKSAAESLQRSCRDLEDGLVIVEGRVKDLYKSLIDVKMALLGILSRPRNL